MTNIIGRDIRNTLKDISDLKQLAQVANVLSNEAKVEALKALSQSDRTQKELTQAILAGDSSPLGGQLSVGEDGTVYDGPQERLIAEKEAADKRFTDNEKNINVSLLRLEDVISPLEFGAKGDANFRNFADGKWYADAEFTTPATDDTEAIQEAINHANGDKIVDFGDKLYLISKTIKGVAGKRLRLKGAGIEFGVAANRDFVGYMLEPQGSPQVQGFSCRSFAQKGVYGIGSATAGPLDAFYTDTLYFHLLDYGMKFDGNCEFPLRAHVKNIGGFGMRTAGQILGTDAPTSGQSAMSIDVVAFTNLGINGVSASSVQVTRDFTSTSDRIVWNNDVTSEFGWVIQRRPQGSTNKNAWVQVGRVNEDVTSFDATKTAGTLYDYQVVRRTIGSLIKNIKALHAGAFQNEYFAEGVLLENVNAANISTMYSEWRGAETGISNPIGVPIHVKNCLAIEIGAVWSEYALSVVEIENSPVVKVGSIISNTSTRSAIHLIQSAPNQIVDYDMVHPINTPVILSSSNVAYTTYTGTNPDASSNTPFLEKTISHTDEVKWTVRIKNAIRGIFGARSDGQSYLEVDEVIARDVIRFGVPTFAQVVQNDSQSLSANVWTKLVFNYELADENSEFSNSRFVAKRAGRYDVSTYVQFNATTAQGINRLALYKNGTVVKYLAYGVSTPNYIYALNGDDTVYLDVGDYVEIYAFSSVATNVLGGLYNTGMTVSQSL